MTTLNIPGSPNPGDTYEENGVIYTWNGEYWTANNAQGFDDRYVNADGDQMTGDLTVPSLNGGPLAGLRNVLVNGDFRINQRGHTPNSSVAVTANTPLYLNDRWCFISSNAGNVQVGTSASFPFAFCRQGANVHGLRQLIEIPGNENPGPFVQGSVWTLSVWSNQDLTAMRPAANFVNGSDNRNNAVVIAFADNWEETGEAAINGYTRYYSTVTISAAPHANNNAFEITMQRQGDVIASAFNWAFAQLEPGPVATPFEHRPIQTELALCQRYYQAIAGNIFLSIYNSDAKKRRSDIVRAVPMRAIPTETATSNPAFSSTTDVISMSITVADAATNKICSDYTADAEL